MYSLNQPSELKVQLQPWEFKHQNKYTTVYSQMSQVREKYNYNRRNFGTNANTLVFEVNYQRTHGKNKIRGYLGENESRLEYSVN